MDTNKVRIQVSECQAISCCWDTSRYIHKWIQGENTSVRASCKFQWLPSAHAGITPFAHIWALLARASHPDVRFKLQYFNSISVLFEYQLTVSLAPTGALYVTMRPRVTNVSTVPTVYTHNISSLVQMIYLIEQKWHMFNQIFMCWNLYLKYEKRL